MCNIHHIAIIDYNRNVIFASGLRIHSWYLSEAVRRQNVIRYLFIIYLNHKEPHIYTVKPAYSELYIQYNLNIAKLHTFLNPILTLFIYVCIVQKYNVYHIW